MRNSSWLKWAQNIKSGKENKSWIHSPETLQKGHVVYVVKFLGRIEVDESKGFPVIREAIRKLQFNQQLRKSEGNTKLPKVELTISIDGIAIQDPKTKAILHQYPLYRISYCADDKVDKQFISFIVKEPDSDNHTCYVFLSDKLSEEITMTIGQAFELAYKFPLLDISSNVEFRDREKFKSMPNLSNLKLRGDFKRNLLPKLAGMEKEEECEHHLLKAMLTNATIPTPEVVEIESVTSLHTTCDYVPPKQLIRVQPFVTEDAYPEYDADTDDEEWIRNCGKSVDLPVRKFENIMDKLEKNSTYAVITLQEAKRLLTDDTSDVITTVYDYWLNKRLRLQHPLIPTIRTEYKTGSPNDPYVAFRRRKDKIQTRKNRKNDEASYEKMLLLKNNFKRALNLLYMLCDREESKKQLLENTKKIYELRFKTKDFSGMLLNEAKYMVDNQVANTRPSPCNTPWTNRITEMKENSDMRINEVVPKKEKRTYRKRKIKELTPDSGKCSEEEEEEVESSSDENPYAFRRKANCDYLAPKEISDDDEEEEKDESRLFYPTFLSRPGMRCIGLARRRLGRGGRIILDRIGSSYDDIWKSCGWTVFDTQGHFPRVEKLTRFKPKSATEDEDYESDESSYSSSSKPIIEVKDMNKPSSDQVTRIELDFNNPLKGKASTALFNNLIPFLESGHKLDSVNKLKLLTSFDKKENDLKLNNNNNLESKKELIDNDDDKRGKIDEGVGSSIFKVTCEDFLGFPTEDVNKSVKNLTPLEQILKIKPKSIQYSTV